MPVALVRDAHEGPMKGQCLARHVHVCIAVSDKFIPEFGLEPCAATALEPLFPRPDSPSSAAQSR